jgi:hypothetical protein
MFLVTHHVLSLPPWNLPPAQAHQQTLVKKHYDQHANYCSRESLKLEYKHVLHIPLETRSFAVEIQKPSVHSSWKLEVSSAYEGDYCESEYPN